MGISQFLSIGLHSAFCLRLLQSTPRSLGLGRGVDNHLEVRLNLPVPLPRQNGSFFVFLLCTPPTFQTLFLQPSNRSSIHHQLLPPRQIQLWTQTTSSLDYDKNFTFRSNYRFRLSRGKDSLQESFEGEQLCEEDGRDQGWITE